MLLINQDTEAKAKAITQFKQKAVEKFGEDKAFSLVLILEQALENEDKGALQDVLNTVLG